MCTRCIRFMEEVEGDAQIGVINRGYGSEIGTFRDGRAFAHLGQPDGRLPGRRDHDQRLPLQVTSLGQPERRRHHLHAVLEGLQHECVAEGEARMGEGARLIRLTPRYNPDVNGYWMCDIGRFWLPLDRERAAPRTPLVRNASGQQAVPWNDAVANAAGLLSSAQSKARFLVSAHASHEELFVLRRLVDELGAAADTVALSWRTTEKQQPASTKFRCPRLMRQTSTVVACLASFRGRSATRRSGGRLRAAQRH